MNKYLILVLILAIILVYFFRTGYDKQYDDNSYITYALQISNGTFSPTQSPYAYSWAFPYFIFLSGFIFGHTSYGFAWLTTTLEYFSLILLTYILALRLYKLMYTDGKQGVAYATLSALLVAIMPFTIQIATRVLNDMLLGVIATLVLIFFLSDKKSDWLLAGAMVGFLIYIKLIGIIFIIPFLVIALISRKRLYVISAFILILALFTLPFFLITGNPLYAFQNYGAYQASLSPSNIHANLIVLFIEIGAVQSAHVGNYYQLYSYGILLWIALLGTIIAFEKKDKYLIILAVLFWFPFLYLHFGTTTLSNYIVHATISRYLILMVAPFAILIVFTLANIYNAIKAYNRHLAYIFVIAVILLYIASVWGSYATVYQFNRLIDTGNYALLNKLTALNATS